MYADELTFPPEDLSWLDAPLQDLVFEDTHDFDEILRVNPMTLSPPQTAGHSTYTQPITIRIPHWVLASLRQKAVERGLPYQSLINQVLVQHVLIP